MRLDRESKQYVAINIHRGLTRHESCSFGKASSCTRYFPVHYEDMHRRTGDTRLRFESFAVINLRGVSTNKTITSELNLPDFCILPNQANSLLNFRKAKNCFPTLPYFFCIFYYIILHIYFQYLPDIRSKFALQLIDISICTSLEILVRLYRNMLQSTRMIF